MPVDDSDSLDELDELDEAMAAVDDLDLDAPPPNPVLVTLSSQPYPGKPIPVPPGGAFARQSASAEAATPEDAPEVPASAPATTEPDPSDPDPILSAGEACRMLGMRYPTMSMLRSRYKGTEKALPGVRSADLLGKPYVARTSEWMAWAAKYYRTSAKAQRGYGYKITEENAPPALLADVELSIVQRRTLLTLSHRWRTDIVGVIKRILTCPPAPIALKVEGVEGGSHIVELNVPKMAWDALVKQGQFLDKTPEEIIVETIKSSSGLGGLWR